MPRRIRNSYIPFSQLAKHRRGDLVIALKNKIQRTLSEYGPRFTSNLVLEEPGRPECYNQWFDFYFLGSDRFTIWNATIVTATQACWEEAWNQAYHEANARLTPQELEEEHARQWNFTPASFSPTGKVKTYTLDVPTQKALASLDGKTLDEYRAFLESEILQTRPPVIHEHFRIDPNNAYGIGLDMVVDAPFINRHVIEQSIDSFLALGQHAWSSEKPVEPSRLPRLTEIQTYDEWFTLQRK
jgi:hypothetical protein